MVDDVSLSHDLGHQGGSDMLLLVKVGHSSREACFVFLGFFWVFLIECLHFIGFSRVSASVMTLA